MYPLRYMRGALDTEVTDPCANRHLRCLTCTSTRVSMWEPKAGGAPPERNPLNRQLTRRKESDNEESSDWGNRGSVRTGRYDRSACSPADRNDRGYCEGRSEETVYGLHGSRSRRGNRNDRG